MTATYADDFDPHHLFKIQHEAARLYALHRGRPSRLADFTSLPPGLCQLRAAILRASLMMDAQRMFSRAQNRGYQLYWVTWVHPTGRSETLSPDVVRRCVRRVQAAGRRLGSPYLLLGFVEFDFNVATSDWQAHEHFMVATKHAEWRLGRNAIHHACRTPSWLPGRIRAPVRVLRVDPIDGATRYGSKGLMLHGNTLRRVVEDGTQDEPLPDEAALELTGLLLELSPWQRVIIGGGIKRTSEDRLRVSLS